MRKLRLSISILICFLIIIQSVTFFANADFNIGQENKISAQLQRKLESVQEDEKIPIYIWYNDINHKEVENEVFEKTGLTSDYLLNIKNQETDNLGNSISVSKTEEKKHTDDFISSKRKFSKQKYIQKSASITEELNLNSSNILFKSKYSPMIIVEATKKEIKNFSNNANIDCISLYEKLNGANVELINSESTTTTLPSVVEASSYSTIPEQLVNVITTSGISDIRDNYGIDGSGSVVGLVETANPTLNEEVVADRFIPVGNTYYSDEPSSHSHNTGRILAGEYGVAPNATVYTCAIERGAYTQCNDPTYNYMGAVELLLDPTNTNNEIIKVINLSWLIGESEYSEISRWSEHIVSQHNVCLVVSAGNGYHAVYGTPANAHNAITVGAYDNCYTTDSTDDIRYDYSSYNDNSVSEKPDILAPANMLGGGTSSSAPYVSGLIALMYDYKPSLALCPELTKAILMASCQHKALSPDGTSEETMNEGITNKQGAGVVNPVNAMKILSSGQYGYNNFSASSENYYINSVGKANTNINIVTTWLNESNCTGTHTNVNNVSEVSMQNIDMYAYNAISNSLLGTSIKTKGSTEMIYFALSNGLNRIKINLTNSEQKQTSYAYAWSTNSENSINCAEDTGVFCLRNKLNGKYLTMSSTGTVSQSNWNNSTNQMWIMKNNGIQTISLQSANSGKYLTSNGTTVMSTNSLYNLFEELENNNLVICDFDTDEYYLTSNGTTGVKWSSGFNNGINFCLERLPYFKGDINLDFTFSTEDANIITSIVAQSYTPNAIEKYLADVNGDGNISVSDSRKVINYINSPQYSY